MNLNEGLKVICKELLKQAQSNRVSAKTRITQFFIDKKLSGLLRVARLEITADSLEGLGKALTVEKVERWAREHESDSC